MIFIDNKDYPPCILNNYGDGKEMNNEVLLLAGLEFGKYNPYFEEFEYYANGYGWESLIEQSLGRELPELLSKIYFDSEGDTFLAHTDTQETQIQLAKFINQMCASPEKLRYYLENVNPDEMD